MDPEIRHPDGSIFENSPCPIHIIHGTNDRLISFSQSQKLKALYPDKITLHKIDGGKHNDLPEFPEFFEILYDILYVTPGEKSKNGNH